MVEILSERDERELVCVDPPAEQEQHGLTVWFERGWQNDDLPVRARRIDDSWLSSGNA